MGKTDPLWRCCYCHGPWQSVALNDYCSNCSRPKCENCEVLAVNVKRHGSYGSKGSATGAARAQPKNKRSGLRSESPEISIPTPNRVIDPLVCPSLITPPSSVRGPSTSPLLSPCTNTKLSTEQHSLAESPIVTSPSEPLDLNESSKEESSVPVSKASEVSGAESKELGAFGPSVCRNLSQDTHATSTEDSVSDGQTRWLDSLSYHPLHSTIIQAWTEFWTADAVDRGGSIGNTQESTPSSSGSSPDGRSDQRPSEGIKRRRGSNNKDKPGDAKKVKTSDSDKCPTVLQSQSRLACHFYKMNSRQHRDCMGRSWHPIGHVKQHLQSDHKLGPSHCKDCWTKFADEVQLEQHLCTPTGGKPVDQLGRIPRLQGPCSQWYWIWDQLFPNFPRPATPYYTDADDDLPLQQFLDFALAQYPSLSRVEGDIRAAAQNFLFTPAYTLNGRQLPTPATTVSDDDARSSPAVLQMPSENANIPSDLQESRLLSNEPDEGNASPISLDDENPQYQSQFSAASTEERVGVVRGPAARRDGVGTTNSADNTAEYDPGGIFGNATQERVNERAWNPGQASTDDLSDGTYFEQRTFTEATAPEGIGIFTWSPEQAPMGTPSHQASLEDWHFAEGMTEDEHFGLVMPIAGNNISQHWKDRDETMDHFGDPNAEDHT